MDNDLSRQYIIDALTDAIEYFKNIPSAEPVRIKGKWYRKQPVNVGDPSFFCSECRVEFRNPYNYCPHCGAKMDIS